MKPVQDVQKYLGRWTPEGDDVEADLDIDVQLQSDLEHFEPPNMDCGIVIDFELEGDMAVELPDLPCPEFPVVMSETRAIDQVIPETGLPLFAEKARRINIFHVVLQYDMLTAAERAIIDAHWSGGAGLFNRFEFQVPGEPGPRWFVFLNDQWTYTQHNAAAAATAITLLDVTRGGE
jgi:hypothetical protein